MNGKERDRKLLVMTILSVKKIYIKNEKKKITFTNGMVHKNV